MGVNKQIESHFLNLYSVALSDSKVETKELTHLYGLGEAYGVNQKRIDEIIENPHRVKFSIPDDIYKKIEHLYDLANMIVADGKTDPREAELFEKICIKYSFKEENSPDLVEFLIEEAKKKTPKKKIFNAVKNNIN